MFLCDIFPENAAIDLEFVNWKAKIHFTKHAVGFRRMWVAFN